MIATYLVRERDAHSKRQRRGPIQTALPEERASTTNLCSTAERTDLMCHHQPYFTLSFSLFAFTHEQPESLVHSTVVR